MQIPRVHTLILLTSALALPECDAFGRQPQDDAKKITVTDVQLKSLTITQRYRCQIRAHHHIEIRSPVDGYVVAALVKEGQTVKRADVLFEVGPPVDKERPDAESRDKAVSIKAYFDGRIGRLPRQRGSFVLKGETLTTLTDNSVMWVYYNVPEARYLESGADVSPNKEDPTIELVLANGNKFPHAGKIGVIDAQSNIPNGNIAFRADFPNPDGLLTHGQTGTVLINRVLKNAVVIPQRATFENLDKRYVYVVDKDRVVHQREIVIQNETEDLFVVKKGLEVGDKIVLEGIRLVRSGDKVE